MLIEIFPTVVQHAPNHTADVDPGPGRPITRFINRVAVCVLVVISGALLNRSADAATPEELIRELAINTGRAPSLDDFTKMIDGLDAATLDRRSLPAAWYALRDLQKPSISLADLITAVAARRDSITSLDCSVEVVKEDFDNPAAPKKLSQKCRYAHTANTYYKQEETADDPIGSGASFIFGYDGKVYRQYFRLAGQTEQTAGILELKSKQPFFPPQTHPLCLLMLLDSKKLLNHRLSPMDFAVMAEQMKNSLTVFEQPEQFDGVSCTVVASGAVKALVDVKQGCVLRRLETYAGKDPYDNSKPTRAIRSKRTLEKFAEVRKGVILPQLITQETYSNGAVKHRTTVKIVWNSVNEPIPVSLSQEIIPKGARVLDVVQKKIYREGIPGSDE